MTGDKPPAITDDRDPVDRLAEEFAERLRRGEHPSVSDYAAAHPEYAAHLLELLPAVAQMECLKRFRRATGLDGVPDLPDRFGDFRIVRELGRGGMGVVFEAVQESLGRPVALKVLAGQSQHDGIRRERFIREAHAAARLHHSNIVPVFGVGEQDNIPYYVMQLIRGQGLNAVANHWRRQKSGGGDESKNALTTVPTLQINKTRKKPETFDVTAVALYKDWRFVAEVGLQAAEALHYAHKQGVLHRDVKPANLLLDATRRVWITDFGLAKVVDFNAITASGDILGTLQYLAPECLAGDSDPRSDVYGLGATLYELLTLIPPYPADTPARLLKQVADTDPVPPREKNPEIPLDLETIVLKAMAREPDRRYISARDLAQDLRAFLDDRPIKARRQTWTNRVWRWCRRNPAVALLTPTAVVALFLAAAGGWVAFARSEKALQAENARLSAAESARVETESASRKLKDNLQLSLAAFEAVFEAAAGGRQGYGIGGFFTHPGRPLGDLGGFGGPRRPDGMGGPGPGRPGFGPPGPPPGGEGGPTGGGPEGGPPGGPGGPGGPNSDASSKAAMLEAVLAFYDRFAEQNATNLQLQFEAAKARRRVGEARLWLEQAGNAKESFARAITALKALHEQDPANPDYAIELALTYLGAPLDTPEANEQAVTWALGVVRERATGLQRHTVGLLSFKLGVMCEKQGKTVEAKDAYENAIAYLSAPEGEVDARPPPVVTDQAWARYSLAAVLMKETRWQEAKDVFEALVGELEHVAPRNGLNSFPQQDVKCNSLEQLAIVYRQMGNLQAADDAGRSAQRLRDQAFMGRGPHGGPKGPGKGPKKD